MSEDGDRIAIEQLHYVRLGTKDLAAAADFAQRVLGLQLIDKKFPRIRNSFCNWGSESEVPEFC